MKEIRNSQVNTSLQKVFSQNSLQIHLIDSVVLLYFYLWNKGKVIDFVRRKPQRLHELSKQLYKRVDIDRIMVNRHYRFEVFSTKLKGRLVR